MSSVSYCLDKPNQEETYVILRVNHKGERIVISTGIRIPSEYWIQEKQRAKKTTQFPRHPELNIFLSQLQEEVERIILENKIQGNKSTLSQVKEKIKIYLGKSAIKKSDFYSYYDEFIKANEKTKSNLTIKKYHTCKKHLIGFEKAERYEITFEKINNVFYNKMEHHYYGTLKVNPNTFGKDITVLKTFLKWVEEREPEMNTAYKKFKVPKTDTDIVYLTEEELQLLYQCDLSKAGRLEKVRDIFCLECYTGLRYSDMTSLSKENIKKDHIIIRTHKTKELLNIPLYRKEAYAIIKKYFTDSDKLPVISNQKMNDYLKEVCKLAGINEKTSVQKFVGYEKKVISKPKSEFVTTHTARRTFVTLNLEKGIRPEIVMKVTGHKEFKVMKRYMKLTEKVVQNEFTRAWENPTTDKKKVIKIA